jgi:K+-sensing histidine kinase KdpD
MALGGERVRMTRQTVPVGISLAAVGIVTAMVWHLKLTSVGLGHPIFVFLPLIALIAMLYGSLPASLGALAAMACSAFFLYKPLYSFHVSNRMEVGDIVCFALLAFIGVVCTRKLMHPPARLSAIKSRG